MALLPSVMHDIVSAFSDGLNGLLMCEVCVFPDYLRHICNTEITHFSFNEDICFLTSTHFINSIIIIQKQIYLQQCTFNQTLFIIYKHLHYNYLHFSFI